jgi:hypothetical protein
MTGGKGSEVELDDQESNAELVLFQVKECYVYMVWGALDRGFSSNLAR